MNSTKVNSTAMVAVVVREQRTWDSFHEEFVGLSDDINQLGVEVATATVRVTRLTIKATSESIAFVNDKSEEMYKSLIS